MLLPIGPALGSLQGSQKKFHTFLSAQYCLKCVSLDFTYIQNNYMQYIVNSQLPV